MECSPPKQPICKCNFQQQCVRMPFLLHVPKHKTLSIIFIFGNRWKPNSMVLCPDCNWSWSILMCLLAFCISLRWLISFPPFPIPSSFPYWFVGALYGFWILTLYLLHVFHIFSPSWPSYFNFVYSFFHHNSMKLNLLNTLRLQGFLSCFKRPSLWL